MSTEKKCVLNLNQHIEVHDTAKFEPGLIIVKIQAFLSTLSLMHWNLDPLSCQSNTNSMKKNGCYLTHQTNLFSFLPRSSASSHSRPTMRRSKVVTPAQSPGPHTDCEIKRHSNIMSTTWKNGCKFMSHTLPRSSSSLYVICTHSRLTTTHS